MGASRDVHLRMSEESFLELHSHQRAFLQQFRVDEEKGDWNENMKDENFSKSYKKLKEAKKEHQEIEFQLREQRRKQLNNKQIKF